MPYQDGSRDFKLFMNQELRATQGVARRHGQIGAFVSELEIDSDTYQVEEGRDLIDPDIRYWDYVTQTYRSTPSSAGLNPRDPTDTFAAQLAEFSRFCSSTISEWKQLYNPSSKRGYAGQIYFANEENGDEGRVFGVTTDGQAQQLPRLGMASWENSVPAYNDSDTTVVVGDEDGGSGQIWVHVGAKQKAGTPFDKAGLTNGTEYVLDSKTRRSPPTRSSAPPTARAKRRSSRSAPTRSSTGTARAPARTRMRPRTAFP